MSPLGQCHITNAGQSESYGGELELNYQASDTLNVYGSLGLLQTEFKSFNVGDLNLSGQAFSNAPETTAVLGALWGRETGWFVGGNVQYLGSALSRIETGGERAEMDSYVTIDAQLGYAWDSFAITGYATNLFDETYFTYLSGPEAAAAVGDPREFGVRLTKSF
ncbi:TonB-dependent receptor domain-containing protein [Chachezhania antarctica]|uniref:TonB-dependent receptor domain-containing protein n=1 Tax=Chachezhania antarctica TaxID=2340860 RepID=UPI0013CE559C|nr:TonB-dependent receptor [Chachezhania antarctica]|tara:strand:+ start:2824 stop:3315 length:492 start_codon:yes stop_codon:yes gene_type:complete